MKSAPHQVQAWRFQDILLESYDYAPGKAENGGTHFHAEYQVCLSLDFPGVYAYRGAYHSVPVGSLSILHPGEKHSSADPEERTDRTHYCLFYIPPTTMQRALSANSDAAITLPFFPNPILLTHGFFRRFIHLHSLLGSPAPLLEQESRLFALLLSLIHRHADIFCYHHVIHPEPTLTRRVKSYIEDNYRQNISLTELAALVERHPVHLHQSFQRTVGLPPHAYQTQVRMDHAKRLLAGGMAAGEVAQEVGFFDQSHFGKHFRRHTGITPARYFPLKTS